MMTNSEMCQGTQGRVQIAPCGTSQAILEEPKVLAALRKTKIRKQFRPNCIPGHMPMMAMMAKSPFATSALSFLVLNSVDSVKSKFAQFAIKRNLETHTESPEFRGSERSCQSQGRGQGCPWRSQAHRQPSLSQICDSKPEAFRSVMKSGRPLQSQYFLHLHALQTWCWHVDEDLISSKECHNLGPSLPQASFDRTQSLTSAVSHKDNCCNVVSDISSM